MKKTLAVLLLPLVILAALGRARIEEERVDTNHSTCGFSVPIMGGLSRVTGKFSKFEVKLDFDPAQVENASVTVTIDAASIDTGIDDRDAHMRAPDFFDVENHPTIRFESKQVVVAEGDRLEVTGDLTIRDVTQEVVLAVNVLHNEDFGAEVFGFFATTTIDRTEFGVAYQHRDVPNFIGNDVDISIHTYARLR